VYVYHTLINWTFSDSHTHILLSVLYWVYFWSIFQKQFPFNKSTEFLWAQML
jgi:hypothetical protein